MCALTSKLHDRSPTSSGGALGASGDAACSKARKELLSERKETPAEAARTLCSALPVGVRAALNRVPSAPVSAAAASRSERLPHVSPQPVSAGKPASRGRGKCGRQGLTSSGSRLVANGEAFPAWLDVCPAQTRRDHPVFCACTGCWGANDALLESAAAHCAWSLLYAAPDVAARHNKTVIWRSSDDDSARAMVFAIASEVRRAWRTAVPPGSVDEQKFRAFALGMVYAFASGLASPNVVVSKCDAVSEMLSKVPDSVLKGTRRDKPAALRIIDQPTVNSGISLVSSVMLHAPDGTKQTFEITS
jgi:hypothetical protein